MKYTHDHKEIVDNFDELIKLFKLKKSDPKFYFVQIVTRQKDHKEKVSESAIQEYYIRSKEELMARKNEIIELCKMYGARAYINMTPKSFKNLQDNLLKELVNKTISCVVHSPRHLLKHLASELDGERSERIWLIDTDTEDEYQAVVPWLISRGIKWEFIRTISFGHLLTPIFNSHEFEETFPNIHLHKNSMGTLLYFEKSFISSI